MKTRHSILFVLLTVSITASHQFTNGQTHGDLNWAFNVGGIGYENGNDIAIDPNGNVIVCGKFSSNTVDFDPSPAVFNLHNLYSNDIFLAKYDPQGGLIWARRFVGDNWDEAWQVDVDAQGNIYMAGKFNSTVIDFDPTPTGVSNVYAAGLDDFFIAKYTPQGTLLWVHSFGGSSHDRVHGLEIDYQGNLVVTGVFGATVDFDPSSGQNVLSSSLGRCFIAKYDALGNHLWAYGMGSSQNQEKPEDVSTDELGNVYVTGRFSGTSFDVDPNPSTSFLLTSNGSDDVFIAKYSPQGVLTWAKSIGSSSIDEGIEIQADELGNVYVTGRFSGTSVDFDPGSGVALLNSAGFTDIFLAKYDQNGNYLWAHGFGSANFDYGFGVTIDTNNNVYCTGGFKGTGLDFDPHPVNTNYLSSAGGNDIYLAKFDPAGNHEWSHSMGGTGNDAGLSLVTDGTGSIYVTGQMSSSNQGSADFDPSIGVTLLTSAGLSDLFVASYSDHSISVCVEPTNLNESNISGSSVQLNWDVSNSAYSYLIQGRVVSSGVWNQYLVNSGQSSSFQVSGLYFATAYEWQIRSICAPGDSSPWSALNQFTTGCTPTDSTWINASSPNAVQLAWNAIPGATSYQVRGKRMGNNYWSSFEVAQGNTMLIVTGLSPTYNYHWTVRAICDSIEDMVSEWAALDTFSTSPIVINRLSFSQAVGFELNDDLHEESISDAEILLFPNPSNNSFIIHTSHLQNGVAMLKIKDLSGRTVHQHQIITGTTIVDVKNMNPGMYLVLVNSDVLKLVVE